MHRLFPRAVVACIREGRQPDSAEVARVTERVWAEAVSFCAPDQHDLAERFAFAALGGCPALSKHLKI